MSRGFVGNRVAVALVLLALAAMARMTARQQPNASTATVNVDTVGPQVGDALPAFSLRDQGGRVRSLESLLGRNGAVIVFFRSADW